MILNSQLIKNHDPENIEAASYDLRIGAIFKNGQIINNAHPDHGKQIIIKPGEVVTMLTREELKLPADIAATAYAMNSKSSEGLLVLNPGHVDPGFEGPLSMVALNLRKVDLALGLGDKIFTIVFDQLAQPANKPYRINAALADRERSLNKKVVEMSMGSIGELLTINSPFTTSKQVGEIVSRHWATIIAMILTVVAALGGVVAAIFAVVAVYQNFHVATSPQTAPPSGASENTMPSPHIPLIANPAGPTEDIKTAKPHEKK